MDTSWNRRTLSFLLQLTIIVQITRTKRAPMVAMETKPSSGSPRSPIILTILQRNLLILDEAPTEVVDEDTVEATMINNTI